MRFLFYLKEIHTFSENGNIPRQIWGDELQAVWFAKYLRKYGHIVDIFGEFDFSRKDIAKPKEQYDVTLYFEPTIKKYPNTKKHILWNQAAGGINQGYDFILTASSVAYNLLKSSGKVIYFLPAIDEEERFYVNRDKNIDVLFIGNYLVRTPDCYAKYLDPLLSLGINMEIWGNGWQSNDMYKNFYKGKLPLNLTNEKISESKIYLNIHHNQHIKDDMVISRVFDGCICKSLVVSDSIKYISNLYPTGGVVTTDGKQDLINTVQHFLTDTNDYNYRVGLGYETTKNMHTWENRVKQFLTFINTHIKKETV